MRRPLKPEEVIASPRLRVLLSRRRTRRLLVLSGNLCYLALLGLFTRDTWPPLLLLPLMLVLTLAVCAHGVLLNVGTQLVAASRVHDLDERQREVWRRAHHRAYRLRPRPRRDGLYAGGPAITP